MTIQTTRWSPDTCDCVIEYEWDDAVPLENREHILSNYIRKCEGHATLTNDLARWNDLLEENPRKNRAIQTIIDNAPVAFVEIDAQTGQKKLKKELSLELTAVNGRPPNRTFTLTFKGSTLTQNQINFVQNKLDERFGEGKVTFVNVP